MKPVLIDLAITSLFVLFGVFLLVVLGVGTWLLVARRRGAVTRDHLVTGVMLCAMSAVVLYFINKSGHFTVHSYGAMLMLGFVAGSIVGIRLGKRRGIAAERILDLGLVILVGAVIGARLFYMLITPDAGPFLDLHAVLRDGVGGLSFHGGLLGGSLACFIYVWVTKINFWRVADSLAPGVALGYAITRIGCFLNGCCFGKSAPELPWGVTFPNLPDGCVAPVHPTQLYAMAMGLLMCGILLLLSRGKSLGRAGRLLMAFLVLEAIERFVMEIYRYPDPKFQGGLTEAQLLCVLLALGGGVGWFLLPKYPAVDAVAEPSTNHTATV